MALGLLKDHKGHQIQARANQEGVHKTWIPRAIISWGERDKFHTIYGSELWDTEDEATLDAIDLAIEWIEQENRIGRA